MDCRLPCASRAFVQLLAEMQIVLSSSSSTSGFDVRLARVGQGSTRAQEQGQSRHDAPECRRQAATHEEIIRCEKRRSAKNKSVTYLSNDSGAARARHGNPSIADVGLELAACLMLDREARLNHQVLDQSVRAPGLPHRREAQDVAVEGRRQCSTFRCFRRQAKKSLTPL